MAVHKAASLVVADCEVGPNIGCLWDVSVRVFAVLPCDVKKITEYPSAILAALKTDGGFTLLPKTIIVFPEISQPSIYEIPEEAEVVRTGNRLSVSWSFDIALYLCCRGKSAMPEGSQSALHQGPMGEESPQLSAPLSHLEHEAPHPDSGPEFYAPICMDPLDGESERPSQSFGSTVALPSSATPPIPSEDDIDLELSPAHCNGQHASEPESREHWNHVNQWNNNNTKRKSNGKMRHFQPPPVITDAMAPNPKLTYVDRVVMEIIETERMYVRDLRSIVEDYLAHIIDTNNLPIRPEQVCALFGNIEDIYEFNSELLQSLDMCQRDPVAIAQCFVDKSESFEIYTQYCNNYPNSVAALTDCMRCKNLAKFFRDRQATLKRSLPWEIAKHFDPDEEGCEVVQEAIETMTGVAWYINDMKRKHEHAVRVQEIQSLLINWKGADLTTCGELVLEGTFHVLRAKNTRTLFLFEKMLLITKKRGENYVYKTHISCSTLMLLDSAKDPLLFSVIHFKHPKQPHTVQAKSIEEKNLWSQNIKRLILENHSTIVPPKAKEAMLDNANYPSKYNYSPEGMKKSSNQPDDLQLATRTGRRKSEPAKQIIRSAKAVLKDDDKEVNVQNRPLEEKEPQSLLDEHEDEAAETDVHTTQVTVADRCSIDCVSPTNHSHQPLEVPYCHTPESLQTSTPEPQNTSRETVEEEEELGSDSFSFHVEGTNVLTNGELSEEEPEMVAHSTRMLNQSIVTTERYINSISRQSSLISEDLGSVACSSPLTDNEPLTSSSVCLDLEKDLQMGTSSPEPLLPPNQPELNDFITEDRRSTLSKQDRLLIHKIRTYYEHAEDQDVNFSIKRRESLSYIPAGLVRHLSKQINSAPLEQATPPHRKELSRNRPTSWSVFDLPGLDKSQNTETMLPNDNNDIFKSSSEMLKLWEEMDLKEEELLETQNTTYETKDLLLQTPLNDSLESSEENIFEHHTSEHRPTVTPPVTSPAVMELAESDNEQDKGHFSPEHLPKSISFRTSMEEDQILQDMGKMKNKVFQLARQYSQRIKHNKPVKWQKSQETGNQPGLRSMPAVQEERMQLRKNSKPNLRLALNVTTQAVIHEVTSPSPMQTPSSGLSSHSTLVSPQTPESENFHWPDVQELRSKYTQDNESSSCKVSQSSTLVHVPHDSPLIKGRKDSLKYSSSSDLHKALADCPRSKSVPENHRGRFGMDEWPISKGRSVLCRWSSLDHMLSSQPLHEVQNLQRPVKGLHTTSQLCLTSRDSSTYSSESHLHDGLDSLPALSSGKLTESNICGALPHSLTHPEQRQTRLRSCALKPDASHVACLAGKSDFGEKAVDEAPAHLSDAQIQMIKDSWKVIRDDIAKVGIIMFVRLFETHPECKDVFFLFRDVEDLERLKTSRELRAHGLRVMSFIEKSVARLDHLERLETLANELGKSHYHYNAPPKYYNYVGAEFICAVQPILKDSWTPELEDAWKTMFRYVTGLMKQGYQEESTRQHQLALSPKDRPEKRSTAL
ncbi:hypothetical protein WMY93_017603 [Mugilogobius chulae]|uniref:Uncharacterized protein n=1 Tax=Mugilogobius chulae TaxID=88201 RepID=A0AAW0NP90_9GOBI